MSKERVHILGICGTFMGGLALMGKEKGIEISGCDENIYPPMSDHLKDMGDSGSTPPTEIILPAA